MNIMHIVYAKLWGGAEQYVYNFCKEEKRRGYHNIIMADIQQPKAADKFKETAITHSINLHGIRKWFSLKTALQLVDEHHVNILNCHSGTMAPLCIALKLLRPHLKLVIYRHNTTPNRKDWYHRYLQKKTDAFVCVSKLVYDLQYETAYEAYKSKFHLIYNGIDTTRLHNLPHKSHQPIRIGYAGRLVQDKGILVLLQAVKILTDQYKIPCELHLAGTADPVFKEKCMNFITTNKLETCCHFLQFVEDISTFYERIDLFVLPSLVKESFGFVLCEAMYSGLPVISTNNGAQPEILGHENELLIEPNNATALAKQIALLATDEEKYQYFSAAGHKRIKENFTLELSIDKMNELYRTLKK